MRTTTHQFQVITIQAEQEEFVAELKVARTLGIFKGESETQVALEREYQRLRAICTNRSARQAKLPPRDPQQNPSGRPRRCVCPEESKRVRAFEQSREAIRELVKLGVLEHITRLSLML